MDVPAAKGNDACFNSLYFSFQASRHIFIPLAAVVFTLQKAIVVYSFFSRNLRCFLGLEIRGCREPRAPLNSPVAPSNFCREPKDVLVSMYTTYLGSVRRCIWAPWIKA